MLINKRPFNLLGKAKSVFGKTNSDVKPEILGAQDSSDVIDSVNTRIAGGATGSLNSRVSIGGEEEKYSSEINDNVSYTCIGSCSIEEDIIEFWTDELEVEDDIITVNGVIMSKADWLFKKEKHLQIDTNENKAGGEIYFADDLNVPCYILLKDLKDNYNLGTLKYFEPIFNRKLYEVNLYLPIDQIVFDGIVDVGTGSGLPVGQYSYSHRYVSNTGESTSWSVYTPLAFVPENYVFEEPPLINVALNGNPFPFSKTLGNEANPNFNTNYGLRLKLRVNNIYNYDFIEIKRVSYNSDQGSGYTPPAFIVKSIPIIDGQLEVITYVDSFVNQSQNIAVSDEQDLSGTSVIERAKSIRYFFNKIILVNIKYADRSINDGDYSFKEDLLGDAEHFPIVKNIGLGGHKIDLNHCYYKSFMNGEAYGFSIVFWDENFKKSFAVPIKGLEDYTFPNRRDEMVSGSLSDLNSEDAVVCANVRAHIAGEPNPVTKTFEVFDANPMEQKLDIVFEYKNIVQIPSPPFYYLDPKYNPFTPVSPFRKILTENPRMIDKVYRGISVVSDEIGEYNPYVFRPSYRSLGLGISGLETYPSWARAFSIVRTKPAKKVVCQGFAFWKLTKSAGLIDGKSGNSIIAHIPDIENGVVDSFTVQDMQTNPQRYKVQMVAPLGFATETYNRSKVLPVGVLPTETGQLEMTDQVCYARLQYEKNGKISNIGQSANQVGVPVAADGYIAFGTWRNGYAATFDDSSPNATPYDARPIPSGLQQDGNHLFEITSFAQNSDEKDATLFDIAFSEDLYMFEDMPITDYNLIYNESARVHEPVYIFNIVRDDASVQDLDFSTFQQSSSYTKLVTTIGFGNGQDNQKFTLCGEREEDITNSNKFIDNYIYVDLNKNGEFFRFICRENKDNPQKLLISTSIITQTPYTSDVLQQPAALISGSYDYSNGVITIYQSQSFYSIPVGAEVQYRYDNRFAIKVFGGDTYTGIALAPVVNREIQKGGYDPNALEVDSGNQLPVLMPFPYAYYKTTANSIYVTSLVPPPPSGPGIYGSDDVFVNDGRVAKIRQMVFLYDVQSRFAIHLAYGDCFPVTNYVQRPMKWVDGQTSTELGIYEEYDQDRKDEYKTWTRGGFKIFQPEINKDFSQGVNNDLYPSGSSIYEVPNTIFPTRIIWSSTRPIQNYNAPNLKYFSSFSIFDISDNFGEIKRFYIERSSEFQENLYAITDDNICLVMTRKRTITDTGGGDLSTSVMGDSNFITEQVWVGNPSMGGLHRDYWMTFAEGEDGAYFANRNSVYKFSNNKQLDIASELSYFKRIKDLLTSRLTASLSDKYEKIASVYDRQNAEYWIAVQYAKRSYTVIDGANNVDVNSLLKENNINYPVINVICNLASQSVVLGFGKNVETFYIKASGSNSFTLNFVSFNLTGFSYGLCIPGSVIEVNVVSASQILFRKIDANNIYSRENFVFSYVDESNVKGWNGIYDYIYDKYLSIRNKVFGSKATFASSVNYLKTNELNLGVTLNGENIDVQIYGVVNPEVVKSVEFVRVRIGSSIKPTSIDFFDKDDILLTKASIPAALLKNYHQFENLIPKRVIERTRFQSTYLTFRITSKQSSSFSASFLSYDYKIIR